MGILDLGGASTQISFELPVNRTHLTPPPADEHVMRVEFDGSDHDVFAVSYLCYGLREAKYRHMAELAFVSF